MRENRTHGSEGREANAFLTPINSMRRITAKSVHITSVNNYRTRNHTPQLQAKNTLKFPSEIKASTFSEVSKVKAQALLQSIAPTSNSTPFSKFELDAV